MKKISSVLVCLTVALIITACQKSENTADVPNAIDLTEPVEVTVMAETKEPASYAAVEESSESSETEELFVPPAIWEERLELPTADEIEACNSTSTQRSPYIAGWLKNDKVTRFTQSCADIKADYLPFATYLSPVNLTMDYSSLKDQYINVWNEDGIGMYAGLQRREAGKTSVGIMAFWDIYCEDENGNVTTFTPERIYPESVEDASFGGEGEGAHTLIDYDWKPGKWYRMLIQCGTSETTGNTTVEQWVQDMETEEWISLNEGLFLQNFDYPGSYNYGTDEDTFWIITTGVKGKSGGISEEKKLTVTDVGD